jgi:hypothetical protein
MYSKSGKFEKVLLGDKLTNPDGCMEKINAGTIKLGMSATIHCRILCFYIFCVKI